MMSAKKYVLSPAALLLLATFYCYGFAADPCISWGKGEIEVEGADGSKTRAFIVARVFPGIEKGTVELIHGYTKGILLFNVNGTARVNSDSLGPIKITCFPEKKPSTGGSCYIESEPVNLPILEKIANGDRTFGKTSVGISYVVKDDPEGKSLIKVSDLEVIEVNYFINGKAMPVVIQLHR